MTRTGLPEMLETFLKREVRLGRASLVDCILALAESSARLIAITDTEAERAHLRAIFGEAIDASIAVAVLEYDRLR